jgi:hypothetical protein
VPGGLRVNDGFLLLLPAGKLQSGSPPGDCAFGAGGVPACATRLQLSAYLVPRILGQVVPANLFLGLATFPAPSSDGAVCTAGSVVVPVSDATSTLEPIAASYQSVAGAAAGGGPLAATLEAITADPVMGDPSLQRKYVVLITGGLPNCDAANPCATEPWSDGVVRGCESQSVVASQGIQASPPAGCLCSFGACLDPQQTNDCCPAPAASGSLSGDVCLDGAASVAAVSQLYSAYGIQTSIVAMGMDWAAQSALLQQLAEAGHGSSALATTPEQLQAALQALFTQLSGG